MGTPPNPEQPGQGYPGYPPQGQQPGYPPQGQQPAYPPPPPSGYPPQGPNYPPSGAGYPPPGAGYPPPPGYGPQGPGYRGYPQGYPQGYPPMQPQRPPSASRWGPTSIGIDPAIGAGLCYIVPILGVIFFFVEKTNRFMRFHAAQAVTLQVVSFIIWIPVNIVATALSASTYDATGVAVASGFGFLACISGLLALGLFALWLVCLINAFQGKYFKIPVVGDFAESLVGGPPQPLF